MMKILSEYMTSELNLSPSEQKFLIFKFKCVIYDLSKFIILFLFFYSVGYVKEFLFAALISIPLRTHSGGLHFKHYLSCFLFSFGYFTLLIYGLSTIQLPTYLSVPLMLLCAFINFRLSPILSASRPPLPAAEIHSLKQKTFILTIYCTLIVILFYQTTLTSVGYWTILLHSMQLIIAKMITKGGEKHER